MGKIKDLTNQKFGKLFVLRKSEPKIYTSCRKIRWECLCDCGKIHIAQGCKLKAGETTSCGCNHYKKGQNNPLYTGFKDITGSYWNTLVRQAKNRNLKVDITIEDIWNKYIEQNRKCKLTGLDIQFSTNKKLKTASVDRIDSSKGYSIDNIQIVHKDLNSMKMDFGQDYFIKICRLVTERNS